MTTLDDLYVYYSRQHGCMPNSGFRNQLREMYSQRENTRNITELSLGKNYLGPKGLLPVFDLIRNIHSLQSVDLSGNGLDNEGAIHLVEACIRHPSLARLDLSRNSIHDGASPLFIRLLKENSRILNLILTGNNFSSSSREKISLLLNENRETPLTNSAANSSVGLVPARATPYRATLEDFVTSAESGGSLSYEYSWRKNPQYRLAVSKASKTRITLTVSEPAATRLVGFVILKTKDARKALITDRTQHQHFLQSFKHDEPLAVARFIGETTYSDTSCTLELDLDATSTPCDSYVIIPHTFQPGKAFSFKLTCEVPPHLENCATVTLERVPSTDSWIMNEIEGAWTEQSAGGPLVSTKENPAWRLNDMIRVRLDTNKSKSEPDRHQSAASFFVLLSIQNEEQTEDNNNNNSIEYRIGMDVLRPETSECVEIPRRPLRGTERVFSYPHKVSSSSSNSNITTIAFAFDTRCNVNDTDFFLVPSLQSPGLTKSYRVAIFSSVQITTSISAMGGEWSWKTPAGSQLPQGQWDVETCGGCRADNPTTWINNPCYRVVVPDPYPVDMMLVLSSPGPAGGGIFRCENNNSSSNSSSSMKVIDVALEVCEANTTSSEDSSSTRRLFAATSNMTAQEHFGTVSLWCNNLQPGREYWIIPQTRVAGTFAPYRLNMITSSSVMVMRDDTSSTSATTTTTTLSHLLRQQQLNRYEEQNAARRTTSTTNLITNHNNNKSEPSSSVNNNKTRLIDVTKMRENAVKLYGSTGEMFVDRDFPRGPSSLWLNAEDKPITISGIRNKPENHGNVPDYPEAVHDWGRLSEMVTSPTLSPLLAPSTCATVKQVAALVADGKAIESEGLMKMGVDVEGVDDYWFFSAVCSVASKKALASKLIVHADFEVGIFQFRFFKNGVPQQVCIDDYIPLDGAGALCFSKSKHSDDLFFPLIEKAWAKLHRCYEALDEFSTTRVSNPNYLLDGNRRKLGYAATPSLISQALADLTGGIPIERSLTDKDGQEWAATSSSAAAASLNIDRYSSSLWSLLLDAHLEDVVVGIRLCSKTQPRALEKATYAGVFLDRLYPVIEAIEAEGVKLVCIMNPWGWETDDQKGWTKGKWVVSDDNRNWTAARRSAFDVDSRPINSFWVSLEELLYYFGVVHYVDLKSASPDSSSSSSSTSLVRVDCPIQPFGGPPESREWIYNNQYALNLENMMTTTNNNNNNDDEDDNNNNNNSQQPPTKKFATVIIGLHDEDRRVRINRESGARVDYSRHTRIPLRICVIQVPHQNDRRITVLNANSLGGGINEKNGSGSGIIIMSSPPSTNYNTRDIYYTVEIPLDINKQNNNKYIVMPCYDHAVPQDYSPTPPQLNMTLSAFVPGLGSSSAYRNRFRPTLTLIEDDRSVTVNGEWNYEQGTAGGPETYPEWRSNPQYLLYPSSSSASSQNGSNNSNSKDDDSSTTVSIILRQRNNIGSTVDHIGFVVLDTLSSATNNNKSSSSFNTVPGASRIMKFNSSHVIASAPHQNSDAVTVSVKLQSINKRKGLPYIIVPSTAKPGASTGFSLTVVSNKPMQIKTLDAAVATTTPASNNNNNSDDKKSTTTNNNNNNNSNEFDWKFTRIPRQKISVADGTAGGSTQFSSWRNNLQYCCRFPVGKTGRLIVTMIKRGASTKFASDDDRSVGLVCFHGDEKAFGQGGRRKRLFYRAEDVAAMGTCSSGISAEIDLNFENCTGSLLVMPFAELPFTEVDFDLVFYSTVDITVEPALEWHQYCPQEGNATPTNSKSLSAGTDNIPSQQFGSWVAGSTAGGPRHTHGWINNPFYGLTVSPSTGSVGGTRVFILVMQYPHGPEKLMARKVGRQRVYIPPPIVNDHLAVEFGVDLVKGDSKNNFPVVACSQPTRLAETFISAVLEPLLVENEDDSDNKDSMNDNNSNNGGEREKKVARQYLVVPHTQQAGIEADYKIICYSDRPLEFAKLPPADLYRGRNL